MAVLYQIAYLLFSFTLVAGSFISAGGGGGRSIPMVDSSPKQNNSHFILMPNTIRPGSTFSLKVTILKAEAPVHVTAGIQYRYYSNKHFDISANGTFDAGTTGNLDIQLPTGLNYRSYDIVVKGTGGLQFYHKQYIYYKKHGMSFYVQTDKGIYKPGQTVHMRIFALLPTLRSFLGKMKVSIFDPNNNHMAHWADLQEPSGIVKKDFKLTTHPIFGNWRIAVEGNGQTYSQYFEVKEYVLPKFEVSMSLPHSILKKDSKLEGSVTSKYTYGKGVKGTAEVEIFFSRYDRHRIKQQLKLTDTVSFNVTMEEIKRLFLRTYKRGYECSLYNSWYKLTVNATVTDELTGKVATKIQDIKFHNSDIKLEFPAFNAKNIKPGLELVTVLQVHQYDGEMVAPDRLKAMRIHVSTMYQSNQENTVVYTPSPEGTIVIRNQVPKDASEITIQAEHRDNGDTEPVRVWYTASKFKSPSNSYLELSSITSSIKSGDVIRCKVKTNFPLTSYVYMVLSRGKIMHTDSKTLQVGTKEVEFSFPSTTAMAPSARILVYTIKKSGEVLVDGLTISVENPFDNEVTLEFRQDSSRPGDNVWLNAQATPGSRVFFLAVDKSVLLMNKDNDISRSKVLEDLQSFVSGSGWYPWWNWHWYHPRSSMNTGFHVSGNDADSIFQNSGLITFTDCLLHKANYYYPYYRFSGSGFGGVAEMSESGGAGGGPGGPPGARGRVNLVAVKKVRTFFPETWLWEDVNASSTGEAQISTKAPDTITSWVASAFAISPKTGFGIGASKPQLKVFQPFFISLDLPYSVVRGEEVAIKALIFNYLSQPQEVTVTFKASRNWKAINTAGAQGAYEQDAVDITEVVTVPAGQGKDIAFPIITTALGKIPLEVQAQSTAAADAVRRELLVEPEGLPQEYSYSLLIDLNSTSHFRKTLEVALPTTTVPGSSYVKTSLIGDILGSSFNNLGNLLRMPRGCGEQNMLNFAPNVFILKYLKTVDKVSKEIKTKAEIFMEQGYQREQSYRHRDGSYSAFGRLDNEGSMWLTAFVVKSFAQARDYTYIDISALRQSILWMVGKQNKDGSFPKVGPVLSGAHLKGGLNGNVSLTAYVTIALAEVGDLSKEKYTSQQFKNINSAKRKAVLYLENHLDHIIQSKDVYSLAITTYALRLIQHGDTKLANNSVMSEKARSALLSLAIKQDGMTYWSKSKPEAQSTPFIPYYRPRSTDIEITAYALLTLSLDQDLENGLPVVRWISQQRNSLGGYASTQDTVLGIQAMSEFASFIYSPKKSFKVSLTHSDDDKYKKEFQVDINNEMVLQQVVIPQVTCSIHVQANGHGFGMLQMGVTYHIAKKPAIAKFDFTVTMLIEEEYEIEIEACAQYLGEGDESNMAIMELGVPSGFSPDDGTLRELLNDKAISLKRTETKDKKLFLYFDKIKKDNATCIIVRFERTHAVGKGKPVPAVVYDYYSPENRAEELYLAGKLQNLSVCQICPHCVNCNQNLKPKQPV